MLLNEELRPEFAVGDERYGFIRDIQLINDQRYLIATSHGVYTFDYEYQTVHLIERNTQGVDPVLIVQNDPMQSAEPLLWYAINGRIRGYNFPRSMIFKDLAVYEHKAPINDGAVNIFGEGYISPSIYLAAEDGLYRVTYSNKDKVELLSEEAFKTIRALNDSTLALTNDLGLYRFDLKSRNLQLVITEEFNKKALEIFNDTLHVGSVNGLYKVSSTNFLKYNTSSKRLTMNELFQLAWKFRDFIYLVIASLLIRFIIRKERNRSKIVRARSKGILPLI